VLRRRVATAWVRLKDTRLRYKRMLPMVVQVLIVAVALGWSILYGRSVLSGVQQTRERLGRTSDKSEKDGFETSLLNRLA